MNIVYGGSFNPPTKAHVKIVEILKSFKPKNIILLPVGDNYNKKDLVEFNHRYNMLKILFNDYVVSDLENSSNYKGTYNSLIELNKSYDDIYFVLGYDNLEKFKSWINYNNLIKDFKFIVISRSNFNTKEYLEKNFNEYITRFTIVDVNIDISSSVYRNNPFKNKELICESVLKYIDENKLYKGEINHVK
ncbi:MAG: nicotinate-nicotinamide nucleotide adenylyltransferase [Anaeroplasmataceae bacterium]